MLNEEKRVYNVGEFAKIAGVSVSTLQRWDRQGILKAHRSPTNRRFYTQDQADQWRPSRTGVRGSDADA